MQRTLRGAVKWLDPPGLFSLPSYKTQDQQPRNGKIHNGQCHPLSISD